MLQEIQGDSLGREDGSAVPFDAQERLAASGSRPVLLHHGQGKRGVDGEKRLDGGRHPGDDELLLSDDPALSRNRGWKKRGSRDVALSCVFFEPLSDGASNSGGREDDHVFRPQAGYGAAARCWPAALDRAAGCAIVRDAPSAPRRAPWRRTPCCPVCRSGGRSLCPALRAASRGGPVLF